MARVKYGAGVTPIRGNDLGTVFQTGKYASVIKSKSSGQGQQLRPNLNAQEALSKSSKLYDTLSPGQKADWIAAIPDFPSKDRYGGLLLSTPEDLFLRTVGRLPIDQQTALSKPAAPFAGSPPGPGRLTWDNTKLEYFPDAAPSGEAWSISLFVSPPLSVGVSTRAPNYRRLWFENNSTSGAPIDLTAAYIDLFGQIPPVCHILYCVEVYNKDTPQLLAENCSFVQLPKPILPFIFSVTVGAGDTFQLPTTSFGTYNAEVDWGDSSTDTITTWNQPERTHTFTSAGTYDITISGVFDGWRVSNYSDRLKIEEVKQWGIVNIGSLGSAFEGCSNLTVTATDVLNSTGITSFAEFFRGCSSLSSVPGIEQWDTSSVTDMQYMFQGCSNLNFDFPNFDVSSVTNFRNMFSECPIFNGDITSWDTSSGQIFFRMFQSAIAFDQDISGWDMSNATGLFAMFLNASSFDQPIGIWDISSATRIDFMFSGASSFNQNLSSWDTSSVTLMISAFSGCSLLNQPFNSWDVSNVTAFDYMFNACSVFNQNLNSWDVSSGINFRNMFSGASLFNGDISSWSPSSGTIFFRMFQSAVNFNQDIGGWDMSSATGLFAMFYKASSFNQDLDSWDVSSCLRCDWMFHSATSFNQDLNSWDLSSCTLMAQMFNGATSFNGNITSWDVSGNSDFSSFFRNASSFNQDISGWDVSNGQSMIFMFGGATSFDQDLSGWDITSVTNMNFMFDSVTLSTSNYDSILVGWESQAVQNNVSFDGGDSKYTDPSAAATARADLIADHSWTIVDGGPV